MIYLITYGPDRVVEEDYGYFTNETAAKNFVEELDRQPIALYIEQRANYKEKLKYWEAKEAKARKMGFANPDWRPAPPSNKPLRHYVVGVQAALVDLMMIGMPQTLTKPPVNLDISVDGFPLGARVRKKSGSSWHGRVVGYYSTSFTPEGVCVESERESGSVQIYPAKALEVIDGEGDSDNEQHV